MSRFIHYGHLSKIFVSIGKYVERGEVIGLVGNSGASSGSHLHIEIHKEKPKTWRGYVRGMSFEAIEKRYQSPASLYKREQAIPIPDSFPNVGYKFLQFVKDGTPPFGGYWHPGDDVNGLNDFGKPIKNLLPGRVVFLEDVSWLKDRLGKTIGTTWNGGWGRHVFVEVDESKSLNV